MTATGERGRMHWASLRAARAIQRRELHRGEHPVVTFVCIMLENKVESVESRRGSAVDARECGGAVNNNVIDSLAHVLAVIWYLSCRVTAGLVWRPPLLFIISPTLRGRSLVT